MTEEVVELPDVVNRAMPGSFFFPFWLFFGILEGMKQSIIQTLTAALDGLVRAGQLPHFDAAAIEVTRPKDDQFGDYTTNIALLLAKSAGKAPREIAQLIQECIQESITQDPSSILARVEVAGAGHINFYCSSHYFYDAVGTIIDGIGPRGLDPLSEKKKIMVEYSQPNTHKEFHIGHLRNVIIGSTLVNVLREVGHEVVAANYIGDTGTHVAKCLWGLTHLYGDTDIDTIPNKAEFLGKVYAEATKKIDENPEYETDFKFLQRQFELGDTQLVQLWQKTRQWSLDGFQEIYRTLGVAFDVCFYESEEELAGRALLPELLEKKVIEKSEGAIVANLEQEKLGVLVLVRKDGSVLYGLKDIALAKTKFEKFAIDEAIIVVDVRQSLYFRQIFKILERYGFHKKMVHCGYEFVALKDGESMASRKGNVITARTLFESVISKVEAQFPDTPHAEEIGIGAIRFAMLRHSAKSKIEFDIDESVRLDGATGPYVQYAHARMVGILRKAAERELRPEEHVDAVGYQFSPKEKSLINDLLLFSELLQDVATTHDVHKIAHYTLTLAESFHSFYADLQVVDDVNPVETKVRLMLVRAAKGVLSDTLRLMGIAAPERM